MRAPRSTTATAMQRRRAEGPAGVQGCLLCAALLLLVRGALGHPRQDSGFLRAELAQPAAHHKDARQAVHYKYQYAVDDPASGVVNDRWEQRSGDFVKGQYSLLDPDGKVRIVDYEVDGERGFHAVIRTQFPASSLLSIQAASQVHEVYQDSPVNVRARNGVGVPDFALRNPRFSVRDNLPFNYHALDASTIGIDTEEDGAQLQHLDDEAVSAREAQRRKYHRDNHLLPHERLLQHQDLQQDLSAQQDLQEPAYNALNALSDPSRNAYASALSPVYNPRAAYISLRPPPPPSPLPPPNPPPVDALLLASLRRDAAQPQPDHGHAGVPVGYPASAELQPPAQASAPPAPFLFQPASGTPLAPGLHTLALFQPLAPLPSNARYVTTRSTSRSPSRPPRPRVVQHLTETSPGLSARRSYYLR